MNRCRTVARFLIVALFATAATAASPAMPIRLEPVARVVHLPIAEQSGIVMSHTYPGVFWVHNDSGDSARLFALTADGKVIMPQWLSDEYIPDAPNGPVGTKQPYPGLVIESASNIDWEDIALDGDTLYIADTGNNGNARRDLGVYVLPEPNPRATDRQRALKFLPVAYPSQKTYPGEQWHYDCEALFVFHGKLYFVTKHRAPGQINVPEISADLYRLDTAYTDRVNALALVDSKSNFGGWVTAADLSPDGKRLAVLTDFPVASVWLFDTPASGDKFLSSPARQITITNVKQAEGICWLDGKTVLITNEQREWFRLPTD